MTHTYDACPAIPKENMLTFKPKFKRGYHGDGATVRDGKAGSGGVKGNGENVVVVRLFIGTQNRLVALHSALFPRLT